MFSIRYKYSGSFVLFAIAGLVICAIICSANAGASKRNVRIVLSKPVYLRTSHGGNGNTNRVLKRSPPPPSTDKDTQGVEARGDNGRYLIFKSLILAPLAMVVLILLIVLIVPIPVISAPLPGRSIQSAPSSMYSSSLSTIKMAKEVLTSEECIERVSCELSKISRSHDSTSWIPLVLEKLLVRTKWSERIIRGIKGISPSACSQFTCTPAKHMKRTLKSAVVAQ